MEDLFALASSMPYHQGTVQFWSGDLAIPSDKGLLCLINLFKQIHQVCRTNSFWVQFPLFSEHIYID